MSWEKNGVNYWENPDCPREYLENALVELVSQIEGVSLEENYVKKFSDTGLRKAVEHYEYVSDK